MSTKFRMSSDGIQNILQMMVDRINVDKRQSDSAKLSTEIILTEFRKPKNKADNKTLTAFLKQLVKFNPNAKKPFAEYINNFDKLEPYELLKKFVFGFLEEERASKLKLSTSEITSTKTQYLQVPVAELNSNTKLTKNEMKSDQRQKTISLSSPGLSSTKIDSVTATDIADIRKRVAEAATNGLSKSAQSSIVDSNGSTSSIFSKSNISKFTSSLDEPNEAVMRCTKVVSVIGTPVSTQESILLKDLLYCLIGVRSTYIDSRYLYTDNNPLPSLTFEISSDFNVSLRDMVYAILPLANHYSQVNQFMSIVGSQSTQCGQVLQAFNACLGPMMLDYYSSIEQLESDTMSGKMSLNRLIFHLRLTMNTMEVLAEVINEITKMDHVGAKILTFLCKKVSLLTGDSIGQQIIVKLVEAAAVPYFETLERWILKGVVIDPKGEFMIEDNEVLGRAEIDDYYSDLYWAKRYTICRDRVPSFLESMSEQILRTGKYLNVIRESKLCTEHHIGDRLVFSAVNPRIHQLFIEKAYNFASTKLLELLVKERDLMGYLMSIKRYFLLQQGDFINQFMDAAEEELSKNVELIQPIKLENLLGLTLRTSLANHDPYKDHLSCHLFAMELTKVMSRIHLAGSNQYDDGENIELVGHECIAFLFDIDWPMSLILPRSIISQYQMLFRLLFQCKHVERRLSVVWLDNKNILKFAPNSRDLFRSTFLLTQSMLHAIQNMAYYFTVEVIEPCWDEFLSKMQKVTNVDEVIDHHNDFVDRCMVNCFLKSPESLTTVINIFNLCLQFSAFVEKEKSFKPSPPYFQRIKMFNSEFTQTLDDLLDKINTESQRYPTHKYMNLVHRINFNAFFGYKSS